VGAGETREQVPLAAALRETCDALLPARTRTTGDSTAVTIAVPETATVTADPSLLRLVLRNLLDNALRHARAGEVACTLDGTTLHVRDSGPGFSPEDLPYVFDRRFHGGGNGRHGIGLALVRHVAAASGWTATARNAGDGSGAVVSVDFHENLHSGAVDRN
jgi:signal transduction histidine kinase